MFDPSQFTVKAPKPLPVVLLLDTSSSMSNDKIENLNVAVRDMLKDFAKESSLEAEILVSVISFGSQVLLHLPYTKANEINWLDLNASGTTPMGTALKMAKAMIEDKETTPSRAYRPTVVLISDGMPTDEWQRPLNDFITNGRSSKCDRMAMAIGSDADESVLKTFIKGTSNKLFYAENANKIKDFFKLVTMSVTSRSKSKNPNLIATQTQASSNFNPLGSVINNDNNSDEGYW